MTLVLDHLAVSAATLAEGVAAVETALGVAMAGGGAHAAMGTHNRLLALGDLYLEVIAVDPGAAPPGRPRWFDLDRFEGGPRLTNWICRCEALDPAIAASPPGTGRPMDLRRGDFRWRMAVPEDGILPFDNAFPALIQWQGDLHPAPLLPDSGVRLVRLEVAHPQAAELQAVLEGRLEDGRVAIVEGAVPAMRAEFATPQGPRVIG